jgi:UDP-GlcNAc:undecaprenyl-phosphate/decaprenyl-phosphate GlcNAc-1-phosphate transferase
MLITLGDIHISNFQGIFGIHHIPYPLSVGVTLLFIITTVNAYNFIDGIDGLASGLGIMTSAIFGTWFFLAGDIPYAVMSFALTGSLTGFFYYNVFGKENKLFMGDTGSLIIGLISAVIAIRFFETNINHSIPYAIFNAPAVAFAILLVPLFDLARVFLLRLFQKKSPFMADNNHIHHWFLRLLPNHLRVTLLIITINLLIIVFSYYLSRIRLSINLHILFLVGLGILFTIIPVWLCSLNKKEPAVEKRPGFRYALRSLFMG